MINDSTVVKVTLHSLWEEAGVSFPETLSLILRKPKGTLETISGRNSIRVLQKTVEKLCLTPRHWKMKEQWR